AEVVLQALADDRSRRLVELVDHERRVLVLQEGAVAERSLLLDDRAVDAEKMARRERRSDELDVDRVGFGRRNRRKRRETEDHGSGKTLSGKIRGGNGNLRVCRGQTG